MVPEEDENEDIDAVIYSPLNQLARVPALYFSFSKINALRVDLSQGMQLHAAGEIHGIVRVYISATKLAAILFDSLSPTA